jgi:hypothetical protein
MGRGGQTKIGAYFTGYGGCHSPLALHVPESSEAESAMSLLPLCISQNNTKDELPANQLFRMH